MPQHSKSENINNHFFDGYYKDIWRHIFPEKTTLAEVDFIFEASELNSDDLAFFAPELKSWKRIFYITGNATGSIDNLSVKKMLIKSGNSMVDGDISLIGLSLRFNRGVRWEILQGITNKLHVGRESR